MVRIHPDPPENQDLRKDDVRKGGVGIPRPGAIAQLGERLLCKQEVTGSIPVGSTRFWNPMPSAPAKRASLLVSFGCSLKIRKKQGGSGPFFRAGLTG